MKPALLLPLILLAGCASTPPRPDASSQLEAIPVLGPSLTVKTASADGEHSLLEDIPVLGHHFQRPPRDE